MLGLVQSPSCCDKVCIWSWVDTTAPVNRGSRTSTHQQKQPWCRTSLEDIRVSHLDCVNSAIEACTWIPNFDKVVLPKFSANSSTVQLLCCFPKKAAADVCPSIEIRGRDSGGALCANLRGPKGLILNLRAAAPRTPVRARIQADCAV